MGGDYAPQETVKGAIEALRANNAGARGTSPALRLTLVGDGDQVKAELAKHDVSGLALNIVPSVGKIGDDEHPVQALRHKPQASIIVASKLLKIGDADALVSMGSTGASMASATVILGLMEGLERPCIGGHFLGLAPRTVLVDMGSNVDCRPSLLLSFAVLGAVFADKFLGIENPRVGLLSVGAEEAKGNRQTQESYRLFQESHLNFIGNVEGMDFFTNRADVIVCDGFVGNILLKYTEGLGGALLRYLEKNLSTLLPPEQMGKLKGDLWQITNLPRRTGGPLFGVNGAVVVGHGSSRSDGVAGAIATAVQYAKLGLVDSMREELSHMHRRKNLSQNPT
jgi:glycerol-3-phosphate acyltransferase PlsX